MHSRDIIFVVLLVANIMPKEERCLDGAKFPNDFPPSFQIELRQMTEQNIANSVIGTAKMRQKLKILPNFGWKNLHI